MGNSPDAQSLCVSEQRRGWTLVSGGERVLKGRQSREVAGGGEGRPLRHGKEFGWHSVLRKPWKDVKQRSDNMHFHCKETTVQGAEGGMKGAREAGW